MYLKTFVIISCVFSACAKPPKHVQEGLRVSERFSDQMEIEHTFTSLGSGGEFQEKVSGFYADFETIIPYVKEEARELLASCTSTFLAKINEDEGVRPFLSKYPVTSDQISISIAFVDKLRNPRMELSQIHLFGDQIFYSVYNPTNKAYIAIEQEQYQKSVEEKSSDSLAESL